MNEMKDVATFVVGSRLFFEGIDGFNAKDCDLLHLMSGWFLKQRSAFIKKDNEDHILYPDGKIDMIMDCINEDDPLTAGKFLSREFCEYIGATINDITVLKPLFDRMDDRHKYESYIFECYVTNNDFYLTDKQLQEAYSIYLKYRH